MFFCSRNVALRSRVSVFLTVGIYKSSSWILGFPGGWAAPSRDIGLAKARPSSRPPKIGLQPIQKAISGAKPPIEFNSTGTDEWCCWRGSIAQSPAASARTHPLLGREIAALTSARAGVRNLRSGRKKACGAVEQKKADCSPHATAASARRGLEMPIRCLRRLREGGRG
jgi:hypothetical protein